MVIIALDKITFAFIYVLRGYINNLMNLGLL
jgi:hypothetical protein